VWQDTFALFALAAGLVALFLLWPVLRANGVVSSTLNGAATIEVSQEEGWGGFALIDPDTPTSAYTEISPNTGEEYQLVFSDEFETEGRSFYPGDDPFWEAVDLNVSFFPSSFFFLRFLDFEHIISSSSLLFPLPSPNL